MLNLVFVSNLRSPTSVELARPVLAPPARALTTPEKLQPDADPVSMQRRQVSFRIITWKKTRTKFKRTVILYLIIIDAHRECEEEMVYNKGPPKENFKKTC
jgi:hypothetical protein